MRDSAPVVPSLPRPGRMMRIVLLTMAVVSVVGAVVVRWMPGGARGLGLWSFFACSPEAVGKLHLWTLVTSGVLTSPEQMGHVLMALLGFYFLTPDLEKTWGGARLLRMLLIAVLVGNLTVLAVAKLVPAGVGGSLFHPAIMFGPDAALAAVAAAWAREHANTQVRLFFVLPVPGRALLWITLGFCVLGLIYGQGSAEGAVAPFGGVAVGILLGGHPSPLRALWLRTKLALLRRRGAALTVEQVLDDTPRSSRPVKRAGGRAGGPPLRVVQGGLEDELKNRKPPKDKRYLN